MKREAEGVDIAKGRITKGAKLHADEAGHWDAVETHFDAHRINHAVAYSADDSCTNQAESYFSRLRRAVDGQHHNVSHRYLYQYANEAAWREDHRRVDNGGMFKLVAGAALHSPVSLAWKGYWQPRP